MRVTPSQLLERLVGRIESSVALDPIADRAASVVLLAARSRRLRAALSGAPVGHPAHPALVAVPMGSWLAASYLDVTSGAGGRRAAQALVGLGLVSAVPAALTGASDWSYTTGAERRVGFVHALGNYAALGLYAASWVARRRGSVTGPTLAGAGLAVVTATGWLGGHLSYSRGVGVDTTAFDVAPSEWTDVLREDDLEDGVPTMVHAGGLPVLLVRIDGAIRALADRCTHRGAPLHEGSIVDGCIVCPWHSSAFSLHDGSVRAAPATRPQPVYEVRSRYGSVQVRRAHEQGSLRTNPVH
jgi:nitrite reductase/ring-hydroxylating ferredoxin subunit/uncharacterized membrane protein